MSATLDAFAGAMAAGFRRAAARQATKAEAETTLVKGATVRSGDAAIALQLADLFSTLAADVEAEAAAARRTAP